MIGYYISISLEWPIFYYIVKKSGKNNSLQKYDLDPYQRKIIEDGDWMIAMSFYCIRIAIGRKV
ncbi:hypothetical protein M0R19_05105 [Candidatus Pacearchaeota archaeon]|jgi:hypothetical protein|nr:hypothetical protein [Candidatus Pacearchaeota archaeon]